MAKDKETLGHELIDAAKEGDIEEVKRLIKAKADLNAKKHTSIYTALMHAAENGHIKVVELLINAGANLDGKKAFLDAILGLNNNITALILAAENGHTEIAEMLIEAGADKEAQPLYEDTALMSAARNGHAEVVELLINSGTKLNTQCLNGQYDTDYCTPLMSAAENGHTKIVEILVKAGADSTIETIDCQTALKIAKKKLGESQEENKAKYKEIIELIEHPPVPGHNTKKSDYKASPSTAQLTAEKEVITQKSADLDLSGQEETDSASTGWCVII